MKELINTRLAALRSEMQKQNIDAWYISGTDPHASEYIPKRWETRQFISGFTGSYGVVAVTQNKAALWTDSRYFLQAADELQGTGIEMMKLRVPDAILPEQWFVQHLPAGSKVGIDAQTITVDEFRSFQTTLLKHQLELIETSDLFDVIWENRPSIPDNKIIDFDVKLAGLPRKEKQLQVSNKTKELGADYHIVSMLDELAWLYNLRGSDIEYNPVFTGFALIGENESYLFTDAEKIDATLQSELENDNITLKRYDEFYDFLKKRKGKKILVNTSTANYSLYSALKGNNEIIEETSVVLLLKAIKNPVELTGYKKAMQKDGVALVEFLYWLKETVGKEPVTDYEIGLKQAECRAKQAGFMGESFSPIIGYKNRGAIVHLHLGKNDGKPVIAEGAVLMDTGAQYLEGTTDITRTVVLGEVSEQFKLDYTLVLKGMIGLANAKFPYGTKGCNIDVLARQALWQAGLNYGHGTSHGVGHFLNVHESPVSIRQEYNSYSLEPGNVMSNEPAFYREGKYGIRTENIMVCVELEETPYGRFFGFETLTLCPIDTTPICTDLLTDAEKQWINDYHKKVNSKLKPLLNAKFHAFLDELTKEI